MGRSETRLANGRLRWALGPPPGLCQRSLEHGSEGWPGNRPAAAPHAHEVGRARPLTRRRRRRWSSLLRRLGQAADREGGLCRRRRRRGDSPQPWFPCSAAGRRWPLAGSCSALGGSSCWFCWGSSSTCIRLYSLKTCPPQMRTFKADRTRSTRSTTKSATTASSPPGSTSSWGSSRSAKCASTSGRSTWSASGAPSSFSPGGGRGCRLCWWATHLPPHPHCRSILYYSPFGH